MQGHATDAWDFLSTQHFATAAAEEQRCAMMASIRINAWAEVRFTFESLFVVGYC